MTCALNRCHPVWASFLNMVFEPQREREGPFGSLRNEKRTCPGLTDIVAFYRLSSSIELTYMTSGAIFFFGAVIWTTPYRSLMIKNDIPPRFLISWAQPFTTTSFPESAGERVLELRSDVSLIGIPGACMLRRSINVMPARRPPVRKDIIGNKTNREEHDGQHRDRPGWVHPVWSLL